MCQCAQNTFGRCRCDDVCGVPPTGSLWPCLKSHAGCGGVKLLDVNAGQLLNEHFFVCTGVAGFGGTVLQLALNHGLPQAYEK